MENHVLITGRLTKDPKQSRFGRGGKTLMALFSLAHDRKYRNKKKNQQAKETTFIQVKAFGTLAHNVMTHLSKGRFVIVIGRIASHNYPDKASGKFHVYHCIEATSINWDFPYDPALNRFHAEELEVMKMNVRNLEEELRREKSTAKTSQTTDDITAKPHVSIPTQGKDFFVNVEEAPVGLLDTFLDDDPDPLANEPNL
jgi:single stranded DNA-binding protein